MPEDVARMGVLARIRLSEQDCRELAPEIDVVLTAMARIGAVDVEGVVETTHPLRRRNVFRDDVVHPGLTTEQALAAAPAAEGGRFRVPAILGED